MTGSGTVAPWWTIYEVQKGVLGVLTVPLVGFAVVVPATLPTGF